jgi:SAM-dependent methyltransferase
MACPLCRNSGETVSGTEFYLCGECWGFYRHFRHRPDMDEEKARYKTHNNDVHDPRYQRFVSPIVSAVLRDFTPSHSGLDFGAGTGPVISKLLREQGFNIVQYDPFFHNHPALLEDTYDYIVCCEVVEHFYIPEREFALLKRLLKPQGRLYCMTALFAPGMEFRDWHYIRDSTHAFIYQSATMEWIRQKYHFSLCDIQDRLVTFVNPSEIQADEGSALPEGS